MPDKRRTDPPTDHSKPAQLGAGVEHGHVHARHVRRSPALNVIPPDWEPQAGVPSSRAECPKVRPCVFIRCRYHLWLKLSEDRDGRPHDGKKAPSVLWPTTVSSCALDIADRGQQLTNRELGELLGVSEERARVIVQRAVTKLRDHGVDLGVELEPVALRAAG